MPFKRSRRRRKRALPPRTGKGRFRKGRTRLRTKIRRIRRGVKAMLGR